MSLYLLTCPFSSVVYVMVSEQTSCLRESTEEHADDIFMQIERGANPGGTSATSLSSIAKI